MAGSGNRAGGPESQQHDSETGLSLTCFFLPVSHSLGYLLLHLSPYLHASCVYHPSNEYYAAASVDRITEG
jgi:hypothetical protein